MDNLMATPATLPTPAHSDSLDAFAAFLAAVIPGRDAVYVSTPITSGHRYVAWFDEEGGELSRRFGLDSREFE